MARVFRYDAYGVRLEADFPLWPGDAAVTEGASPVVSVRMAREGERFESLGFRPGSAAACLEWPGLGAFEVRGGSTIVVWPTPGAVLEELALIAAGPALAMLLEQRGCVVLHGSCVEHQGSAVAFLGPSGAGKSTLAAALRARGCVLISDGMTVVDAAGPKPLALPGPPHLKLWPDALAALGALAPTVPVQRHVDKRWFRVSDRYASAPVPLTRAFLLLSADAQAEELSPAAALMGLVRNYFLADYAEPASGAFLLSRCAKISEAIAVATLPRARQLAELEQSLAVVLS